MRLRMAPPGRFPGGSIPDSSSANRMTSASGHGMARKELLNSPVTITPEFEKGG
jgi:hypothetical protein